jgi:hypothetical protein
VVYYLRYHEETNTVFAPIFPGEVAGGDGTVYTFDQLKLPPGLDAVTENVT